MSSSAGGQARAWHTADLAARLSRSLPPLRGKKRLGLKLMRRAEAAGRLEGTWQGRLKDGTTLELPRQSLMTWATAFEGLYDDAHVRYTGKFIRPGTIALDVGASLGLWTVQLGKIAAAQGAEIWAFEPNPANIPWISRNVARNDLVNVVTINEMGLGDSPGPSTLVSAEYGIGNGVIPIGEHQSSAKFPELSITLARLDEIDLPAPVSFIKIDVEGYEAAFLRGAAKVIERDRPVIFGEFAAGWLKRRGEDLRATLIDLDYEVTALKPGRPGPLKRRADLEPQDVDVEGTQPIPQNLLLRPRDAREA
jgi:FkbM family methyltransferase